MDAEKKIIPPIFPCDKNFGFSFVDFPFTVGIVVQEAPQIFAFVEFFDYVPIFK